MALTSRQRSQDDFLMRPPKRQRVSEVNAKSTKNKKSTAVALESLPWNDVPLPGLLEDAEGFFGLEEVDDVEVVRDQESGRVAFRLHADTPRQSKASDTAGSLEDEEWSGFESPESGEKLNDFKRSDRTESRSVGVQAKTKSRKKPKEPSLRTNGNGDGDVQEGNTFKILGEASEEEADVSMWKSLDLSSNTLSSLARLGFSIPTPIQTAAIPLILEGHDVIGKASTGSGKTLAFGIPILEHYLRAIPSSSVGSRQGIANPPRRPVALILSPTRELAHQLSAHLTDLCTNASPEGPQIVSVTGGLSVHKQQRLLTNADVIIGTPGRLWEVISGSTPLLKSIKGITFLVLDEADRLLSEGHFKEVDDILNALDRKVQDGDDDTATAGEAESHTPKRQTLVFSATFQKDLQQKLTGKGKPGGDNIMNKQESMEYLIRKLSFREEKPRFIDVNPLSQMAAGLKEGMVECAGLEKDLYLYGLLLNHPKTRTLVFTNSITSVRRLTPFLQNLTLPVHAIHSQMPQKARLRAIERFSSPSNTCSILIATDVAARGLDIPSVELVVHYHLPRAADMYVHRSGRTARAEKSGSSILLCAPEEVQGVRRLVAKVHARNATANDQDSKKFFLRTIELDRKVIARLRPRVDVSKKISDASLAKEKKGLEDNWLKTAAEELGVDYDSEEFAAAEGSKKGRGSGRKKAQEQARGISKGEVGALKAELKSMLSKRINVGVSERYLTAGGVDVDDLLNGRKEEFLGQANGGLGIF